MQYDRAQPYNDLPLLPPLEQVENDPEILRKLIKASRALATVNSNVLRLPNPLMLVNTIALQEAKTSTAIENIFTTEDELYKAISDSAMEEKADPPTKEVLRYREALWSGYQHLEEKKEIDLVLVTSIFQQIKNTSAGLRPQQAMVVIKRGQSEFREGEIVYTPPRGEGVLEKLDDRRDRGLERRRRAVDAGVVDDVEVQARRSVAVLRASAAMADAWMIASQTLQENIAAIPPINSPPSRVTAGSRLPPARPWLSAACSPYSCSGACGQCAPLTSGGPSNEFHNASSSPSPCDSRGCMWC